MGQNEKPNQRTFSEGASADVIAVVNAYTAGWAYTRPIDGALLEHWRGLPEFQPGSILIAYRHGTPVAMLHGEIRAEGLAFVHLLAVAGGGKVAGGGNAAGGAKAEAKTEAKAEAQSLLEGFELSARSAGAKRIIGPSPAAAVFYGGYVLGAEPYHPHWAIESLEVYIRAGYHISQSDTLMVCDLAGEVAVDAAPEGYQVVPADVAPEFGASAFGYNGLYDGQRVAYCHARHYPLLMSPRGTAVGQIGPVGTNSSHRGKGLARVMTQMCVARLREMGAGEAILSTGLDNVPALRAYRRAGFRACYGMTEWTKDLGDR
jgi:GNAT superfamily N-acetyltransferase